MALQFFASYKHKCWKERNIKVGEEGGSNTAIPQYRKKKSQKPKSRCRKSTNFRYRIYDRSRLFQVVSISRVCLSKACMHQQSTSAF